MVVEVEVPPLLLLLLLLLLFVLLMVVPVLLMLTLMLMSIMLMKSRVMSPSKIGMAKKENKPAGQNDRIQALPIKKVDIHLSEGQLTHFCPIHLTN